MTDQTKQTENELASWATDVTVIPCGDNPAIGVSPVMMRLLLQIAADTITVHQFTSANRLSEAIQVNRDLMNSLSKLDGGLLLTIVRTAIAVHEMDMTATDKPSIIVPASATKH